MKTGQWWRIQFFLMWLFWLTYISPITKSLLSYGAHLMVGPFSIALWVEEGINKFYTFFDLTMQSRRYHWSPDKLQPIREVFRTWDSYLRDSHTCGPTGLSSLSTVSFVFHRCFFLCTVKTLIIGYGLNNITIQINLITNCKTCGSLEQQQLVQL